MGNVRHPTRYEKSDADPRLVAALALGIAGFLLATPFLLAAGYPAATQRGNVPRHFPEPPAPRLQIHPRTDLDRLRSYEREQLESFGWADRPRGLAHIPIDRAMQILVDRGLPGWQSPTTAAAPNNPAPR
jgi:hypothetical protein